jgi:hypothetical protein
MMSRTQRFITALVPRAWAESMERESREWMARCPGCGHARSIWDLGGIRWKAAGNPKRYLACAGCGQSSWHVIEKIKQG